MVACDQVATCLAARLCCFDPTAPAQAVLGDLGWPHISTWAVRELACLLTRIVQRSRDAESQLGALLQSCAATAGTWTHKTIAVHQIVHGATPADMETLTAPRRLQAVEAAMAELDAQTDPPAAATLRARQIHKAGPPVHGLDAVHSSDATRA